MKSFSRLVLVGAAALSIGLCERRANADPTTRPGERPEGVFGEGGAAHGDADPKTGAFAYS